MGGCKNSGGPLRETGGGFRLSNSAGGTSWRAREPRSYDSTASPDVSLAAFRLSPQESAAPTSEAQMTGTPRRASAHVRLDMSFDALLAQRNRECPGAPLAAPPAPKPRDLDPRRCKRDWDWYEPPLIPLARILRLSSPAFDAAGHHCRSNAGYFFLGEHCSKTLTAKLRQRAGKNTGCRPSSASSAI